MDKITAWFTKARTIHIGLYIVFGTLTGFAGVSAGWTVILLCMVGVIDISSHQRALNERE